MTIQERNAAILRGYQNGTSLSVLANGYGLDRKEVRAIILAQGGEIRKKSGKKWAACWT